MVVSCEGDAERQPRQSHSRRRTSVFSLTPLHARLAFWPASRYTILGGEGEEEEEEEEGGCEAAADPSGEAGDEGDDDAPENVGNGDYDGAEIPAAHDYLSPAERRWFNRAICPSNIWVRNGG